MHQEQSKSLGSQLTISWTYTQKDAGAPQLHTDFSPLPNTGGMANYQYPVQPLSCAAPQHSKWTPSFSKLLISAVLCLKAWKQPYLLPAKAAEATRVWSVALVAQPQATTVTPPSDLEAQREVWSTCSKALVPVLNTTLLKTSARAKPGSCLHPKRQDSLTKSGCAGVYEEMKTLFAQWHHRQIESIQDQRC